MTHRSWIIALIALAWTCLAQISNTICKSSASTSWLFNSAGESPCVVWAKIQSLCIRQSDVINVPPLQDSTWAYNAPSGSGNLCQCNVVSYSLMAGCTWCQHGDAGAWVSENGWKAGCAEYNNTSISFAETVVSLPAYAFNAWDGAKWDPKRAQAVATVTAAPTVATTTLSRSFAAVMPSTTAPLSSDARTPSPTVSPAPEGSNQANPTSAASVAKKWGPIIGGIVGGVFALVIIGYLLHRCTRRKDDRDRKSYPGAEGYVNTSPSEWLINSVRTAKTHDDIVVTARGHNSGKRAKSQTRSIMSFFPPRSVKSTKREGPGILEDGLFTAPRAAPVPPGEQYTTTSERLAKARDEGSRPYSGSTIEEGLPDLRGLPAYGSRGNGTGLTVNESRSSQTGDEMSSSEGSGSHRLRTAKRSTFFSRSLNPRSSGSGGFQPALPSHLHPARPPHSIDFSQAAASPMVSPRTQRTGVSMYDTSAPTSPQRRQLYPLKSKKSKKKKKEKRERKKSKLRVSNPDPGTPISPAAGDPVPTLPEAFDGQTLRVQAGRDDDDTRTLPSLYDPPTNAPRYTITSTMSDGTSFVPPVPYSPGSKYQSTERPASTGTTAIGAALGSGRRFHPGAFEQQRAGETPRSPRPGQTYI